MILKKRGLGKGLSELGLSELLSDLNAPPTPVAQAAMAAEDSTLRQMPIDLLQPGKYQPRQDMKSDALHELADSIRSQGIIQPIVVRPIATGQYEIIAGERRWRAAQIAGLHDVPVVVRELSDEATVAVALIENIQREDLNAVEEATALARLIEEFTLTHEEVAKLVGKSRATVSNLLRLLALSEEVKRMLAHGDLEMGHARALLSLNPLQQIQIAQTIIAKNLSVREAEKLVQQTTTPRAPKPTLRKDPDIQRLQTELSDKLAAAVTINHSPKGKGKLIIDYNSVDELQGILEHIR